MGTYMSNSTKVRFWGWDTYAEASVLSKEVSLIYQGICYGNR